MGIGVSVSVLSGFKNFRTFPLNSSSSHSIIIDDSELPDNDFFNAWELNNGTVSVNLTKAKALTKTRLRIEREPLLAAQDVLFQRAQESNADTTAIVIEKTRLRNITNLADDCSTTAELRALSC